MLRGIATLPLASRQYANAGNTPFGETARQRVDAHRIDKDRRPDRDLVVGFNAEKIEPVGKHAERKDAEEGAADRAASTEKAVSADQRGGEGEKRPIVAKLHSGGIQLRGPCDVIETTTRSGIGA